MSDQVIHIKPYLRLAGLEPLVIRKWCTDH